MYALNLTPPPVQRSANRAAPGSAQKRGWVDVFTVLGGLGIGVVIAELTWSGLQKVIEFFEGAEETAHNRYLEAWDKAQTMRDQIAEMQANLVQLESEEARLADEWATVVAAKEEAAQETPSDDSSY